ncbi:MAG: NUDIX hydrolase [Candidatus Gracilibacteria bacterium]|nr:NUDIX hydrolase [Candidatus Gracilibacteria bacterium]
MHITKKVVIVAIYNSNNELLLQERGDYSKHGEQWAFFGGGIEEGEGIEEAFYRESKEELDLDVRKFDCKYIGEYITYNVLMKRYVLRYTYLIKTDLNESDFNVLEGSGCKYFSFEDSKKLKHQTNPSRFIEYLKLKIYESNK